MASSGGAPGGGGAPAGTGGVPTSGAGGASSGGAPGVGGIVGSTGGAPDTGGDNGGGGNGGISGTAGTGGASSGGAAGGMGPPDAGVGGGLGPTGGSGGCAGLFCEDFESGAIDPAIWSIKVDGGQAMPSVVSQAGLVGHGKYAAHFHANPNVVSYNFMITKSAPAALNGHHFGRAYFMITPMPPANHTEYIYAGTTGFPQTQYLEVASAGGLAWQLTYVDEVPPATGENYHSGGHVPTGKWFCLEWEFNDTPDQATVYVDRVVDFSQTTFTYGGASTGLVGGFAAFGFGYYAWHPATYPFDLYYDDIVLDTKRVGCIN